VHGSLADELLRDLDPRFVGDDVMRALTLKRHLEENGYYTRRGPAAGRVCWWNPIPTPRSST